MNIGEVWGDENNSVEIIDITEHEIMFFYLEDNLFKRKPHQSDGFRTLITQFTERFYLKMDAVSPIEMPKNRLASVD